MHSIKEIRKDLDFFKKKISERNTSINFVDLLIFDKENRELILKKEKKEQEKKLLSKLKDVTNFDKSKKLSNEIDEITKKQNILQNKIFLILSNIPNIALDEVPIGIDSKSNKIVKQTGNIKKFQFPIKSHIEIGEKKIK
jgi:seryl-tRNA synthetase